MNEIAWQRCADPYEMLDFLNASPQAPSIIYQRRFYLLGCACCRRLWRQLTHEQRARIENAEGNADSLLAEHSAVKPFRFRRWGLHGTTVASIVAAAIDEACENYGTCLCYAASAMALQVVPPDLSGSTQEFRAARASELAVQAALVRDIFGNPFQPSPRINRAWLTKNHGTVARLAQRIYKEHEFRLLPLLADTLVEAGCSDRMIVDHCRRPGHHARGCWLIDLLIDKGPTFDAEGIMGLDSN